MGAVGVGVYRMVACLLCLTSLQQTRCICRVDLLRPAHGLPQRESNGGPNLCLLLSQDTTTGQTSVSCSHRIPLPAKPLSPAVTGYHYRPNLCLLQSQNTTTGQTSVSCCHRIPLPAKPLSPAVTGYHYRPNLCLLQSQDTTTGQTSVSCSHRIPLPAKGVQALSPMAPCQSVGSHQNTSNSVIGMTQP